MSYVYIIIYIYNHSTWHCEPRSYTVNPPRGAEDDPSVCPISVTLYNSSFYVQRCVDAARAELYGEP